MLYCGGKAVSTGHCTPSHTFMKPLAWLAQASAPVEAAVVCGLIALVGVALAFWGREYLIVRFLLATYLTAAAVAVVGGALALAGGTRALLGAGTFVTCWFLGHTLYDVSSRWQHARISAAAVALSVAAAGFALSVALPLLAAAGFALPLPSTRAAAFFVSPEARAAWFVVPFVVALLLRR